MSHFRTKPNDPAHTPVKPPPKQGGPNYTPTKPTRDTEPDDPQRYIRIIRGLTTLFHLFAKKRPTGYALSAIGEMAADNDCLIPAVQDVAVLTIEEKQEWDSIVGSQGVMRAALFTGRFLGRIENERERQSLVFSGLKQLYYEIKDEKETQYGVAVNSFVRLFHKRQSEGFKLMKQIKGNKKIEAMNKRLIVQFVKIMNQGLKSTFSEIYKGFFEGIKEMKRIHHEKSLHTIKIQGNALIKILKPQKEFDVRAAYFQWFLKAPPGERELKKVADTLALYDKINLETAGWRLFRLKPKKVQINLEQKRRTLLFGEILNRLLAQRLFSSFTSIALSSSQSRKLDVIRRIMICGLRKRYLGFNIWHRQILRHQLKSSQTNKVTRIQQHFSNLSRKSLSSLTNTFLAFKRQLEIGQKKKVDAIQQIVSSKNGDVSKMIGIWKNYMISLRLQRESGGMISCFQSLNNKIRGSLNSVFGSGNLGLGEKKRGCLERLVERINGRKADTFVIWREQVRISKESQRLNEQEKLFKSRIQSIHAKHLVDIMNEKNRQKLIEAMRKFRENQERKREIRRVLEQMIKNRSNSVSTALKKISDLRLSKKGVLSNEARVQNSVRLSEFLTKITSIRITETFRSFQSEVTRGKQYKQGIVHRLISVTNEMRKRLYGRWSRIIIQDQNTEKNKAVNTSFQVLFHTLRGLTSNAIYHNNERRKKQHALVRIFRNLMLNENLAFHHWSRITVEKLLVKEKRGKRKYIQALKMVVALGLLFTNRKKDAFDKVQEQSEKRRVATSSRGAIFYNGLVYLIKHNLRKSFRKFTDNTVESDFKKLKLLLVMRDYAFLNEEKSLTVWRELCSSRKQESKITESVVSEEIQESVVKRVVVSSLEGGPKTLRHKVIYESRKEYDEDD